MQFEHSLWRHPFTTEDSLLSKWCNAKFILICSDEETNSSTWVLFIQIKTQNQIIQKCREPNITLQTYNVSHGQESIQAEPTQAACSQQRQDNRSVTKLRGNQTEVTEPWHHHCINHALCLHSQCNGTNQPSLKKPLGDFKLQISVFIYCSKYFSHHTTSQRQSNYTFSLNGFRLKSDVLALSSHRQLWLN